MTLETFSSLNTFKGLLQTALKKNVAVLHHEVKCVTDITAVAFFSFSVSLVLLSCVAYIIMSEIVLLCETV